MRAEPARASALDGVISAAANALLPGSGALAVGAKNLLSGGLGAVRDTIKNIFGSGDYTIGGEAPGPGPGNSLTVASDQAARFNSSAKSTRVAHREFCFNLMSPAVAGDYQVQSFQVTPTNEDIFPWLSNIATGWQKFRVRGLTIEFKSTSSEYSTSVALGKVIIAHNANPRYTGFRTEQQLEQCEGVIVGKPSTSILCAAECDDAYKQMPWHQMNGNFVYQNVDSGEVDPLLTAMGVILIGVSGVPTPNIKLGEIWVSADIELFNQAAVQNASTDQFVYSATDASPTILSSLGVLSTAVVGNSFGLRLQQPTGSTVRLVFPRQSFGKYYQVTIGYASPSLLLRQGAPGVVGNVNCVIKAPFANMAGVNAAFQRAPVFLVSNLSSQCVFTGCLYVAHGIPGVTTTQEDVATVDFNCDSAVLIPGDSVYISALEMNGAMLNPVSTTFSLAF